MKKTVFLSIAMLSYSGIMMFGSANSKKNQDYKVEASNYNQSFKAKAFPENIEIYTKAVDSDRSDKPAKLGSLDHTGIAQALGGLTKDNLDEAFYKNTSNDDARSEITPMYSTDFSPSIDLVRNEIKELGPQTFNPEKIAQSLSTSSKLFKSFKKGTKLDDTQIKQAIKKFLKEGFKRIVRLDLSSNRLSKFPLGLGEYLPNLTEIKLNHNHLDSKTLSAKPLLNLSALRAIRINGNQHLPKQSESLLEDAAKKLSLDLKNVTVKTEDTEYLNGEEDVSDEY